MLTVELVRKKATVPFTKNSELDLEKLLTSLPELFSKNAFQPIGGDPLPGDSILLEQIKKSTQGPMFMEMRQDDFVSTVEKNVGKGAIPESGIRSVLESPFIEETIPTSQITNAREMGKIKQTQNNSGIAGNAKDQSAVNTQQPAVSPPKASLGSGPGPAASPTIQTPLEESEPGQKLQENEWEKDPAEEQAMEDGDGQMDPYGHQGMQGYAQEEGDWYDPHAAHAVHETYGGYGMNGGYQPQHPSAYMQYGGNMHQGYYYPQTAHYPPQQAMGSIGHPNVVQAAPEVLQMGAGPSAIPGGRKPLKYVKDSGKGFPASQSNVAVARQGTGSSPALQTGGLEGEESEEQGPESPGQPKGPVVSDRVGLASQEKSEASGQPQPANQAAPAEDEDSPIKMAAQANMIKSAPITEDIVGVSAEPAGEFEGWEAPMQHPGVPYPESEYGYHNPYGYDYRVEGEEAHKYYPGGIHQYDGNYYDNYYYPPNRDVYPYHYNQRRDQMPPPGHHHNQMMPPMDPYMHGGPMWGYGHGPDYDYMQPGAPHPSYGYGYDYQNPEHGERRGMHEHMDLQQHPHPGQPGIMNGNPTDKRGGKSSQGNNPGGQPKKQKDSQHHQGDGSNPGSSNKLQGAQAKHSDRGQQTGNGPNKKGGSNKPNQSSPNIQPAHPGPFGPQAGQNRRQDPTQQKPGSQEQQYSGQNLQQSAGNVPNRGFQQNGPTKKRAPLNHSNSGQNQGGGPPMPTSFSNLDNLQQSSNQQPQQARKNKKEGNLPSAPARQDSTEDQHQKESLGRIGGGYDYNTQNQNQAQRKHQNQGQVYGGPQHTSGNQKPNISKNAGQPNGSPQQYQNQGLQGNGQKRFPNQNQNPYIGSPPQNQSYSNQNQDMGPQARKQQGQRNTKQQSEEFDDDDENWDSRDEGQTPSGKKSKQQVYFVKK